MLRYIARRVVLMIPILLGVSFIIFTIMSLTPGDPATILLGPAATQEQVAKLNAELGYDKPFMVRYIKYITDIITKFDFGFSYRTRELVRNEILKRAPISLRISIGGIILVCGIGIPIGVLSAVKQDSLLDTLPSVIALILAAVPGFWLGMIMLYYVSLKLGWLPAGGIGSWQHFVSPTISLALPNSAIVLRYTRSSMLETIRQDYVRTARAKGVSERTIIWKHALKNALLPVITVTGVQFLAMLGGAISTETLYSLPGIGRTLVEAIRMKDTPVVMGLTLFLAVVCSVLVLIIDVIYGVIDPRIKAKYIKQA